MTQGTIILPCNCQHEEQDKMYGKGRRVHNIAVKDKTQTAYCTVCTPRRLSCERNGTEISAAPAFGMKLSVPACKPRGSGKPVPQR